ncbi:hypothetical protein [Krasilnikovia sp. MM14-A1259]
MSKKDTTQNLMWMVWVLLGSGGLFMLLLCGVVGLIIIVWAALSPGL